MSRFQKRLEGDLRDPEHRLAYLAADAEAQLTATMDDARKQLALSQKAVGERLGKSQAAVSQFFNAEHGITVQRFVEYLVALGLEADLDIRPATSARALNVSLDLAARASNVHRLAQRTVRSAVTKNPPTKARFGQPRKALQPDLGGKRLVPEPGAA